MIFSKSEPLLEDDGNITNFVEPTIDSQGPREDEKPKLFAVCPQKEAGIRGILKSSPQSQRAVEGKSELRIRQIDKSNMMDQLSYEIGTVCRDGFVCSSFKMKNNIVPSEVLVHRKPKNTLI